MNINYLTLFQSALKDGALHIDASQLEGRFMQCPQEWAYYALHKREAVRDFAGRDFGKFVHDHMMKPHYNGVPPENVRAGIPVAWEAKPPVNNHEDHRTLDFAQELYRLYCDAYPSEPWDVVQCEVPFAIPLCELPIMDHDAEGVDMVNIPVILTGRIDLIVRSHTTGKLRIVDHKTSSVGGSTYFTGWTNSSQLHGYVWAGETLMEEPIEAYDINAMFLRKPTKTGKGIELQRQTYLVGDNAETHAETLQRWHSNTLQCISAIGDCLARNHFPMHTHACVRKYGVCEYHDACRFSPGRAGLLDTDLYQPVTWSPLD